ncbi:uncharacterized protein E0L32_012246 [Thyridium curvatum]|uniref:magnesium chelatase n=1 Tax=Thyridium curvatum TaxID=1093900 RepID=A0A507BIN9_9PEZI|nr:uncharacterized protein E0L32_012246 [Thyridium curvatum]TPX17279.1 hypothetical protein E0L32_012246 [Thyridium curvatum]
MADENLLQRVHDLSDLELAALLSLIAREHCVITTPGDALDDLVEELKLISTRTFGLSYAVVDCNPDTTLEDFATSLLLGKPQPQAQAQRTTPRSSSPHLTRTGIASNDYFPPQPATPSSSGGGGGGAPLSPLTPTGGSATHAHIAHVVLARNLGLAPKAVQIQALELLRTRRIFTRTSVHAAPKQFLFVAALADDGDDDDDGEQHQQRGRRPGGGRLAPHLNDFFYVGHWHDPEDGFANLEDDGEEAETASTGSVVKKGGGGGAGSVVAGGFPEEGRDPVFSELDIATLAKLSREVQVDVDVLRYQMNIVSFLRMHRAVAGGITPTATKHFEQLMKSLAPLHGLDYVTPSLVGLAARKVYLHRVDIVTPEKERSMLWGSELAAVQSILEGIGPDDVIEEVLAMVPAPL